MAVNAVRRVEDFSCTVTRATFLQESERANSIAKTVPRVPVSSLFSLKWHNNFNTVYFICHRYPEPFSSVPLFQIKDKINTRVRGSVLRL